MAAGSQIADPSKKKKRTEATVIDPVTGQPVTGGEGQTSSLADALRTQAPASPQAAQAMGASPDAAKMAGVPVAPTSVTHSAPGQAPAADPSDPEATVQTPKPGQTASPEARAAAATAVPAPQPPQGGAANDLQAAIRYQAPAVPDSRAIALQTQAQGLAQASKGLTGLDSVLKKVGDAARQSALNPQTMGSSADASSGEATGDVTADQFRGDTRTAEERLAQAETAALDAMANYRLNEQDLADLGYATPEARARLAEALGKDPVGATGEEIQKALQAAGARLDAQAQSAASVASDTRLGANARVAAAEQAGQLEQATTGGLQQLSETIEDIEGDQTISFGGGQVPLKDALQDGQVSSWVKEYASADFETRKRMAAEEPDLAEWIDSNKPAVDAAIAADVKQAEGRADVQNQKNAWWRGAQDLGMGGPAADQVRQAAESGSELARALLSGAAGLQELGVQDPRTVGAQLSQLARTSPTRYAEILSGEYGDIEELARMGLGATGPQGAQAWGGFMSHVREVDAVERLEKSGKTEDYLAVLFPGGATIEDAERLLRTQWQTGKWDRVGTALKRLDADGDMKLDDGVSPEALDKLGDYVKRAKASGAFTADLGSLLGKAQSGVSKETSGLANALKDRSFEPNEAGSVASALADIPASVAAKYLRDNGAEAALANPTVRAAIEDRALRDTVNALNTAAPGASILFNHGARPEDIATSMGSSAKIQTAIDRAVAFFNDPKMDEFTRAQMNVAIGRLGPALELAKAREGKVAPKPVTPKPVDPKIGNPMPGAGSTGWKGDDDKKKSKGWKNG